MSETNMSVSNLATIYGCCGLFDLCGDDDLMSLSMEGQNKFLDWLGWERTVTCLIQKYFITYTRPESSGGRTGSRTGGYLSDPCGDSNGADWGKCDFVLEDFSLLRRHGPTRNATRNQVKYCERQPRYRLDGTPITSDAEYDMRVATEALLQDFKRMVVDGNSATPGQFDGLETLVSSGYTDSTGQRCSSMDSIVIDWNANGMNGGAGITWNGAAVGATYDFVDVLLAIIRRIMDRIEMAPQLASQSMNVGDIIFVAPTHVIRCLLDAYTCWSVCPGQEFREANLNTYEARTFRNGLNGGMFGDGKIFLDGFEIPLIAYGWNLVKGPTLADAYVLTGAVGGVKTISGQYLDMTTVPGGYPEAGYTSTDGGRLLTWLERDKTCVYREVEMQPRLLMWAPWAQARIQSIRCTQPGGVLSPDPWDTSFFPESSFVRPACP
jgi:hypothetical protein